VTDYARPEDFATTDPPAGRDGFLLPYRTASEVADTTTEEPDWVVYSYVAREAVTELDGKVKAAGKTTLLAYAVRAILDGERFLGLTTKRTRVVWLTEQQPGPFYEVLAEAGLEDRGDELLILFRGDVSGRPWAEVVADMTTDALDHGYGLLIVDTLGKLAGVSDENSASEWVRAMTPLQDAAHRGLAVWFARHDRKSGGEVGETGRGSSQVSGDADVIMHLGRPEGKHPPTFRVIETLSRYRVTTERLVIELVEGQGYVAHGDEDAVKHTACMKAIVANLAPVGSDVRPQTIDELVSCTGHARTVVRRAVDHLLDHGQISRTGSGKRSDPFRFVAVSGQTSTPYEEGLATNDMTVAKVPVNGGTPTFPERFASLQAEAIASLDKARA
jgi:AAA domain